jgi:tetraacyldisaccharide 4'-kinase
LELTNGDGRAEVESLRGKPTAAFCGIGNPEAFRRTLAGLGADVRAFREFPDHHSYGREDVDELRKWAAGLLAEATVVTTQKDLVKLRLASLSGRPLWALRIGLQFTQGQDEFDRAVLQAARLMQES